MPRLVPLDALGVIHHVTTRGIEDRKIFKDMQEREDCKESAVLLAVRELGMPLADLAQGGNEHSRSGLCHRAGVNNYPELPISADTIKLIYFFWSVPPFFMVRDSITAFINEDGPLAKSVCERDSIIDRRRDKTYNELIEVMSANPSAIEKSLNLLRISRNLERIADLSTNICEDVIFIVEGKIIKHHGINSLNR